MVVPVIPKREAMAITDRPDQVGRVMSIRPLW